MCLTEVMELLVMLGPAMLPKKILPVAPPNAAHLTLILPLLHYKNCLLVIFASWSIQPGEARAKISALWQKLAEYMG